MRYIILFFLIMVLFVSMPVKAETNLISNPGFEEMEVGANQEDAKDWNEWAGKRSDLYSHSGQWSLNSWGADTTGDCGAWQGDIPVTPGERVVFTAYLMSPNETGIGRSPLAGKAEAFIEIEWRGTEPLQSVESNHLTDTTNGEWKQYSVSGVAPQGTIAARFVCKVINVLGSRGDVYFDDLKAEIFSE